MTDLLIQAVPSLSAPGFPVILHLLSGILGAPLFCGYLSALVHLRKTREKQGRLLLHFYFRASLTGKSVCIGFPAFVLPLLLTTAPQPVGTILLILYMPVASKLFWAAYLFVSDESIAAFSAWQGANILAKHRPSHLIGMLCAFWWMVLPVPAVLLACILIVPEQLELSLAIILFTGYLTDLLAGPYLMLSMAELVRYLSTTNPEESSSTPRHPVGFADRMYEWMQGLHGTNLDLPENDVQEPDAKPENRN